MKAKTSTETAWISIETAWCKAPTWVRREIKRLEKMAELGGSSAAIEFERQATALKAKYIWPSTHMEQWSKTKSN